MAKYKIKYISKDKSNDLIINLGVEFDAFLFWIGHTEEVICQKGPILLQIVRKKGKTGKLNFSKIRKMGILDFTYV